MKIYRALGKKEEKQLLESNDIFFEHKTVLRKDWILFEHEEDYTTGKFFFFTIEDACVFLRYANYCNLKDSILEMDIDEKEAFKYIGYGVYCYGDFDKKGHYDADMSHRLPEVFIPYDLIKEKLKNKEYRLITYDDRENVKISFPYNSERGRCFLELGEVMASISLKKSNIVYLKKQIEKYQDDNCVGIYLKELQEDEEKLECYKSKLPEVYKEFVNEHNLYVCPVKEKNKQIR